MDFHHTLKANDKALTSNTEGIKIHSKKEKHYYN